MGEKSSRRGGPVDRRDRVDPFAELKEAGDEYTVYDSHLSFTVCKLHSLSFRCMNSSGPST